MGLFSSLFFKASDWLKYRASGSGSGIPLIQQPVLSLAEQYHTQVYEVCIFQMYTKKKEIDFLFVELLLTPRILLTKWQSSKLSGLAGLCMFFILDKITVWEFRPVSLDVS